VPRGTLAGVSATPNDRPATLRLVASAALLVLSVPCLLLGLPGIVLAVGAIVHATLGRASVRGPAMLFGVIAVSTWWPLVWCLVDARLDALVAALATLALGAFAAALAPLVLAPLALVARTSRTDPTVAADATTSDAITSSPITSSPITSSPITSSPSTSSPTTSDAITSSPITSSPITSSHRPSEGVSLGALLAVPASRHVRARVAVLLVTLAALAPPIWLAPLVGYLLGALGLALGLAFGLPRALRARRADASPMADVSPRATHDRRPREGLALALAWTLAALSSLVAVQLPARATPGALGADARAFDRPRREGPVRVAPHELGFVVSVADGGGAGLVRTPFGRPDRVSLDRLDARARPGERAAIRVCAARAQATACVRVDDDGVRLDDGPLDRARAAYGTSGLAILAVVMGLLLALAVFGARRPRLTRALAFASAVAFAAFALAPWWR
jgi:hypothetical protein